MDPERRRMLALSAALCAAERPAVIPVYQTHIEYAFDRMRAREIGIEIPPALLVGAREIYE